MQNSSVTNRFLIEIDRSNRVWYASNPLQVTRVSRACLLRKRLPLLFHEQRHSVNHIHAPPHTYHAGARIARRSYSGTTALYGFPYSARVSPAIVLVTCARGNPSDFYSSIRTQKLARAAYTEVTTVLRRVLVPHRVAPVMYSFLFLLRERNIGYDSGRPPSVKLCISKRVGEI